jgi:DNA-binding NtrC family response regulator
MLAGECNVARIILIVEDDPATLVGFANYLHGAGLSVIPTSTFSEAHRIMQYARPDVLVADVRLGEYNGLQLVVQARALDPPPGVIVTSGYADPVLAAEAERLGAKFLSKPIEPTRLLAEISRLVRPW